MNTPDLKNGITVWMLPLDVMSDRMLTDLESTLNDAELAKASRFHFPHHRRQYVAAHGLKRRLLSAAVPDVPVHAWRFQTGRHGKPRVENHAGLEFNLTHCDGLVACAIAMETPVGIDAESLHREAPLELIDTYFTQAERLYLSRLSPQDRHSAFFELWTLKESWLKATGDGLSRLQSSCTFRLDDPPHAEFHDEVGGDVDRWHFRRWRPSPTHTLALGWCGHVQSVHWYLMEDSQPFRRSQDD
jgi:4'-phosphopantetheinyl transferase